MHPIWIFYLGAMTGTVITMAVLALFAVGSRADRPLSSSALFSETYEVAKPDEPNSPTTHKQSPTA